MLTPMPTLTQAEHYRLAFAESVTEYYEERDGNGVSLQMVRGLQRLHPNLDLEKKAPALNGGSSDGTDQSDSLSSVRGTFSKDRTDASFDNNGKSNGVFGFASRGKIGLWLVITFVLILIVSLTIRRN